MSTRESIARHRAEVPKTTSIAVIAKAVGNNAGGMGRQAAVIAAASGLVLTSGIAANAAQPAVQHSDNAATLKSAGQLPLAVTAASTVTISFPEATVASTPAPAPVVQAPVAPAASQTGRPAVARAATVAVAAAPAAKAAPAVASGVGATIVAAAYAQLGVHQDCTALVSNSLAAAGIYFHGWPAGYKALGHGESAAQAQPGDLVYYDNAGAGMPHIAVYIGNGQAIHGGMNGGNTEVATAYLGSGPVFIAIGH
jgi:cell wall-associated NlpC family hydrolase